MWRPNLARNFQAAVEVRAARILDSKPPFIKRGKATGRFAVGIRYEREVQDYLSLLALGRAELEYFASPWIEFFDKHGKRWCQPDAVLLQKNTKVGIVVEVKYQHCSDAWFQLKELYAPVLRCIFPGVTFGLVEIVHWHDPLTKFPERYDFTPDPFSVRHANRISVHIYNPKRTRIQSTGCSDGQGDGKTLSAGRIQTRPE